MPINASPHFEKAQREYEQAITTEQKILCLKKMISLAPSHKGAENLRAQLKRRLAKLKYSKEKEDKAGKSSFKGIKKEDMQAVFIGKTNSGKSSLLKVLTNSKPEIADYDFTTKYPLIGTLKYLNTNIQLIENPAIDSPFYDKGLPHTADTLLLTITSLKEIPPLLTELKKHPGKKIILFSKTDKLSEKEKRKISETLKSRKYEFILTSSKTKEGIEDLKEILFQSFGKIRIYTKEPGKEKSEKPVIMEPESNVKDVAEKILHGFSEKVKETKIWGPSSKFSAQKVGLAHKLKDLDTIEFKTK
jgi:ribosome-interacting GTPase 1